MANEKLQKVLLKRTTKTNAPNVPSGASYGELFINIASGTNAHNKITTKQIGTGSAIVWSDDVANDKKYATKEALSEGLANKLGKSEKAVSATTATSATTSVSATTAPWGGITGKPTSYTPSAHTHKPEEVGLESALKYHGVTTTKLTDGSTTKPITIGGVNHYQSAGCVVIYTTTESGDTEFVWNGESWDKLGDGINYKVKQTAVSNPSANGNATAFIDSISQDTNGVITVTKKNLNTAIKVNSATTATSATTAAKAVADGNGNNIVNTYATKTSIPTVNNGKLSIQVNGTETANFTANQSGNSTVNFKPGNNVTITQSGGVITINATDTNTDTHYTGKTIVGATSTATTDATASNGNVWMNFIENGAVRSNTNIKGTGSVTVTADTSGNIVINGTDTDTQSDWNVTATTSSAYIKNKPTIPTSSTVSGWGFTKNAGTVTGVKINGSTKNPSSGVVDLGTVLTAQTQADWNVTATGSSAYIKNKPNIIYGVTGSTQQYNNSSGVELAIIEGTGGVDLLNNTLYLPKLSASIITGGTFDTARIPTAIKVDSAKTATNATTATKANSATTVYSTTGSTSSTYQLLGTTASSSGAYGTIGSSLSSIKMNPSTGTLSATTFSGTLNGKIKATTGTSKYYLLGHSTSTNTADSVYKNANVYMSGGTLYASSDERLKTFIENVDGDPEKIKQIPKVYFYWNNDEEKNRQLGTFAQGLEKVYPELVCKDEDGTRGVSYDKLSVVSLAGIDKLYEMIQELQKKNEGLEKRIEDLENK